ncbi:MAG: aminodeoxychorismate lyase [Lysobacterales bacterium CG02_land_8_20_14_3_00_62_12]|nr:MAG: aminodeoxychorismate lyase [Xanthomonadales bacterium CG02_land_8_20_14_3_00_62_12]PJA42429.1 MAG: aminodeoxychorismate lyase [Xanthomonadales bacterium CG_4_9_14_3_um_filter_62_6]
MAPGSAAMIASFIDGQANALLPISDRGLHYGDGLFTSLRVHDGRPCWLAAHGERLRQGAERLALPMVAAAVLIGEIEQAAALPNAGVIKVLLTRGDGARGYAPGPSSTRRIVLVYRAPLIDPMLYQQGIRLRWCATQLGEQPRLAGIKHLNRLEQVLARGEWQGADIGEGLMCDAQDRVIAATSANLFARFGTELLTPALDRCGIAGLCRAAVLATPAPGFTVAVANLSRLDLRSADELFLSNCLRGIVPVQELAGQRYPSMQAARRWMQSLHPALGLPTPI